MFLANYGDTLTDAPLDELVERRSGRHGAVASFLAVRPSDYPFRDRRRPTATGRVHALSDPPTSDIWINGGYFMLRARSSTTSSPATSSSRSRSRRLDRRGRLHADAV